MLDDRKSTKRAYLAAEVAAEKLGSGIVLLDVGEILQIADWFVIASASNVRQVSTIADEVESAIKSLDGNGPLRTEGLDDCRWVLLDFGDVVVHIFLEEVRTFYDLERLWADVPKIAWSDPKDTVKASS